jgi:sugar/nucleoside kinase (ribokinase family)
VLAGLFVGLVTLDVVQRVENLPGPNEKVTASTADIAAGGPASNAAVAFAALGGRATLLTALGHGPLRPVVLDDLERRHVAIVDAATPGHPGPAISAVSVIARTGERSVVSRNAEQARTTVPDDLPDLLARSDVVLVDGHLPALPHAAAMITSKSAGLQVVLDGGSWKPALADVLGYVNVAVCSADFAVPGCAGVDESAAALLSSGVRFVAFTDGPRPVRWWTGSASGALDVPVVRTRDTLGAGDAFHGAFALAVAAAWDPVEALRFAVEVATVRVQHVGQRAWLSDPRLTILARQVSG